MSCKDNLETIKSLCKRRGFIFQSSDLYGGYSGFWDYGPYGVSLRRAVEKAWWDYMVEHRDDVVGQDSSIICHPQVWTASGHVGQFGDVMVDNKDSKKRYRINALLEKQKDDVLTAVAQAMESEVDAEKIEEAFEMAVAANNRDVSSILNDCRVVDPFTNKRGNWTPPRQFNLMMHTHVGPVVVDDSDESSSNNKAYLRAETCQPIFVNFPAIQRSTRRKLPFGIAQVGKAFRNEINPRNFTFRSREFTQMELEFFCHANEGMDWFNFWHTERLNFYRDVLQFDMDHCVRSRHHEKLAHYAKAAIDIEFKFPFGWGEVEGIHHRGTWDLSQHSKFSGEDLTYLDVERNERYLPTCIETSVGLDRLVLAILCHSYDEEEVKTTKAGKDVESRIVLRLPAMLAPVQVAVLPLSKKLSAEARKVFEKLRRMFRAEFDDTQSIGTRYRRQDEIGTPYCICVDFDTGKDGAVTVRDRDTMEQERVPISELQGYIFNQLNA